MNAREELERIQQLAAKALVQLDDELEGGFTESIEAIHESSIALVHLVRTW